MFNHGTGIFAGDSDIDGFFTQATAPTEGESTVKRNKLALATTVKLVDVGVHVPLTKPIGICDASAELSNDDQGTVSAAVSAGPTHVRVTL